MALTFAQFMKRYEKSCLALGDLAKDVAIDDNKPKNEYTEWVFHLEGHGACLDALATLERAWRLYEAFKKLPYVVIVWPEKGWILGIGETLRQAYEDACVEHEGDFPTEWPRGSYTYTRCSDIMGEMVKQYGGDCVQWVTLEHGGLDLTPDR